MRRGGWFNIIIDALVVGAILVGFVTIVERMTDRTPHLNEMRSVSTPTGARR